MKRTNTFLIMLCLISELFCTKKKTNTLNHDQTSIAYDVTKNGITISSPPSPDYHLIFSDDFNGTQLDTAKWNYRYLGPWRDAVNVKSATYLDGLGNLIIKTSKSGGSIFTGMLDTKNKFDFQYGYLECRAMIQHKIGLWSAFWLLPDSIINYSSPAIGGSEIDIFEHFKIKGDDVFDNDLFWGGYGSGIQGLGTKVLKLPGLENGYHKICLEWTPSFYSFSIDGYETWRDIYAVSQKKEFLILSCEVSAANAGAITDPNFEDKFIVDYVKVYVKSNQSSWIK